MSEAPKALERGLRVLEILAGYPGGLGFGEIRESMGLSDSACHRLLLGLQDLDYVQKQHEQGVYTCGPAFRRLNGQTHTDHLLRVVRPYVKELCDRTGNTALLIANQVDHMLILERFLHEDSIALQDVGTIRDNFRGPPWGWLFKSLNELKTCANSIEAATMNEIKKAKDALAKNGFVIRVQRDRRRLATPLFDANKHCIGAISVGGTPISLPDEDIPEISTVLIEMTQLAQAILTPDLAA